MVLCGMDRLAVRKLCLQPWDLLHLWLPAALPSCLESLAPSFLPHSAMPHEV